MNISMHCAAGAALVLLLSGHAYAGQTGAPAAAQGEGRTLQADHAGSASMAATAPSGSSVVERDKKRYENQKRAADRRAAQMKRANKAGKPAATGSSVVERDQKRYENQKRAAEQRAAEIRKTEMQEQKRDARQQKPADVQGEAPAAK